MSDALSFRSAFESHAGAFREINEDPFLEAPDLGIWAVADGMGGHEAGQLASTMVVDALDAMVPAGVNERLSQSVRERLEQLNRRLREIAAKRYAGRIVGSTVAVLVIEGGAAVCLWAGDSRIYRYRRGGFVRLTRDHSRTEEMIASGQIDAFGADDHPLANVITRAVGAEEQLVLEMRIEPVFSGDRFLLCTDGLTRTIEDAELAKLMESEDCVSATQGILKRSLARGPRDNVTVGIVDVSCDDTALADASVPRDDIKPSR
ncbi:MAG: serine/threonine-protein phosphatase [Rhodospirillales bacterium]|nr:serine/threonine-protein phosphatase [Rhodospirillales bacterium]